MNISSKESGVQKIKEIIMIMKIVKEKQREMLKNRKA